ncbi:hypothetical protein Franean1_0266 [Parafrankia sp. EAN1pec]|uniref:hypothetical protein n=1 Tax=Parafrankia sp. (strain EAN1pec) TaxID=298653 RepID=UPI0000540417|nr:hypothetical protein Franean1_0266 [Frankia sp. EAN1pec]
MIKSSSITVCAECEWRTRFAFHATDEAFQGHTDHTMPMISAHLESTGHAVRTTVTTYQSGPDGEDETTVIRIGPKIAA